jgi:hypothetical protein
MARAILIILKINGRNFWAGRKTQIRTLLKKNNAGRYIFHEVGDMLTGIALAYGE